jgi:hypothetical protein
MDQGSLVDVRINDGKRLIDRLIAEGIAISAAGWLKEADSGKWFLYLATAGGGRRCHQASLPADSAFDP